MVFVSDIPQRTADPDAVVITEISSDLSDDHGHCIGGKFYLKSGVEIIDRFDKANAADLKKGHPDFHCCSENGGSRLEQAADFL